MKQTSVPNTDNNSKSQLSKKSDGSNSSKWQVKKLGEVCEFRNGAAHEKQITEEGEYILINSKFISSDGKKYKRTDRALAPLSVGEVAFVMSDVPNGKALAKCFLIDKDNLYTLNQRIGVISSKEFIPEFLVYQFNRNKYLLSFDNGENQTNLRKGDILNCPLLIPPLAEQKAIVAILDEAFGEIEKVKANTEQNLKNAKEIFESYLQGVFENKGDDWEEKKLGEVCEFRNGLWTGKKTPFQKVGVIRNANFTKDCFLDYSNIVYIDVEQKQFQTRQLIEGDIILEKSGGGPKQPVGRVVIFDKKDGDFSFSNFTSSIRVKDKNNLDFNFLHRYLFFEYISGATEKMQSHSTGIRNLRFDEYKEIPIPLPPLTEQKVIVQRLDALRAETQRLESIYRARLINLEELKKSILQKAFSGEL
jgi:type I restriction enzyme S subunit